MPASWMHADEVHRQATLDGLVLEQTPAEAALDRITALAQEMFDVQTVLVSLSSGDRQWFKSTQGTLVSEIPRAESFCACARASETTLVVEDASLDPRFAGNEMVTGEPHIRFYAGEAIEHEGQKLGTLCLLDPEPRTFTQQEVESLCSLARWVESEVRVISLRDDQQDLRRWLQDGHNSMVDPLTQTWNRRGFGELAQRDVDQMHREGRPSALLLVDLDNFSELNASRGHQAGDEALRVVAQRIRSAARPADIIARFNGDVFVAWLGGCAAYQAEEVAERISGRVSGEPLLAAPEYPASVTIGCAVADSGEAGCLDAMITRADDALRAAKRVGRGSWQTVGPQSAPLTLLSPASGVH